MNALLTRWTGFAALAGLALVQPLGPTSAQDGPAGIGFAQAEEGTWSCYGSDPVTALNCARDLCRAEAGGQDCYRTAWCFPAGWAGVITIWTSDFHSNRPICGAPSLDALTGAMEAFCDNAPEATACDIGMVFDPDGVEVDAADHWIPDPG